MADSFKPPDSVAANARRALAVRAEKPQGQRGMTDVGIARARDISNQRGLSLETIRRMVSYFDRHEVDKTGSSWDERGAGWQAWNGWGGDEGREWAERILNENKPDKGFRVKAIDEEKRLVTGIGYVSRDRGNRVVNQMFTDDDGRVVDHSGDHFSIDELEKAVHMNFAQGDRDIDRDHDNGIGDPLHDKRAEAVEWFVFTPADIHALGPLGMDEDFPEMFLLKIKVHDDDLWSEVKEGRFPMLSIAGPWEVGDEEEA